MPRVKLSRLTTPSNENTEPSEMVSGENEVPLKKVRVPGTIFEVDEEGYLHVPDNLLEILFRGR